jgi:hypothetical protein
LEELDQQDRQDPVDQNDSAEQRSGEQCIAKRPALRGTAVEPATADGLADFSGTPHARYRTQT